MTHEAWSCVITSTYVDIILFSTLLPLPENATGGFENNTKHFYSYPISTQYARSKEVQAKAVSWRNRTLIIISWIQTKNLWNYTYDGIFKL
jgi:hypothetical protein